MLCYRCGSHVPDGSEACTACGQKFAAGLRGTPTGTFSRRKLAQVEGAPYKLGDLVSERYEIKDVIGQGPIGVVYRALDREIDVEIALKVISPRLMQTPDERRSFAKEIRSAKKLSHNNIVKLYDDDQDGDRVFFTQQYLDGLTLRRIIDLRKEKGQFFQLRELEPIVTQIAAALDHAAVATRPHGDLKPENVIVLPDLLKVTDFGLSTGLPRQPFIAAQRGRGADRYLAPEFLSGQEIDSRADIYSLGAMVGEMLAGVLPEAGGPPELASKNRELPHSIEPIYRRAVNTNPGARYPRAGELAADLAGLLEGMATRREPSRSPPPPPSAATRAPGGRSPEPEALELADDDLDEVETPDPRSRAAEVAAGLEAEVVARRPRPPPPPPDEEQAPPPLRSNGRASGIREAKPAGEEPKSVSGVRDPRPVSGVREPGRSSGVRAPPPPPAEPARAEPPPVAREIALERPPERGTKEPKPEPTPSAPLPLHKAKAKPAARGGPSPALLAIAVVLGLGVAFGAFSGWRWWRGHQVAREDQLHQAEVEAHAEQARLDAEERARLAAGGTGAEAPPVIPDADRAAAEQASAKKLAEEQAAAEKAAADKLAADKLAADKLAADKLAAEKLAAEKGHPDRTPAEREAERAERARLEEERRKAALAAATAPDRVAEEARRAEEARKRDEALEEARRKAEEEKKAEVKVASAVPGGSSCPAGMSLVQAGAFKRGVPAGDPMKNFGDLGQESVDVGGYCIDKWEYPNRPKGPPTVRVPYGAAESACKKGGKRLCSEEEWEKACKGPGNARFPYGGTFDAKACNTQDETGTARPLADSMAFPRCRSGYGAYDMAGNVAEWTSGTAPAGKVTKGGAADRPDFDSRCAARKGKAAGSREEFLGFRCCADPK